MNVTKDMVHPDLKSLYGIGKILSFILSRNWSIKAFNSLNSLYNGKNIKGLACEQHFIKSSNGDPDIRVRIFKPKNAQRKLPAFLYLHGGGYVVGSPEQSLDIIDRFIQKRPCVVIAPAYRLAHKAPFPAGFNDSYNTLLWAKENADTLGILDEKFIIGGHSAGGGMTAVVTWKAVETKDVDIAFQMPIYPMIDDRQITESGKDMDVPVWNAKTNKLAWSLYLKNVKGDNIPKYAAAVHNTDYKGFPPTITFVGEYEPFRDETIAYVEALKKEGIPVAYKYYEKCFHGFDQLGIKKPIGQDAIHFTYDTYAEFYDKYI